MKFIFVLAIFLLFSQNEIIASVVHLEKGWKFKVGDNLHWSNPDIDDSNWQSISTGQSWENQGYDNYDGFGWYRIRMVIPSALKESAYLKDSLQFFLGKVDDNDQFYLNGVFIGQNNRKQRTSDEAFKRGNGFYLPERKYIISVNHPAIRWDKENVIAVRIFDQGGGGGLYGSSPSVGIADIAQYLVIDKRTDFFKYEVDSVKKTYLLKNNSNVVLKGNLSIEIKLEESQKQIKVSSTAIVLKPRESKKFHVSFEKANQPGSIYFIFRHRGTNLVIHDQEELPYILTPKPEEAPSIKGARVAGVRPGKIFLFTIPVTGLRPMTFEAPNLPDGLVLDKKTGIITGKVEKPGDYHVTLSVENTKGKDTCTLTIKVGNQIALTPPMGWNSWNCWGLSVDQEKVLQCAKAFKEKGLTNYGWTYINMDDGWQGARDENGEMAANNKFPDIKALCDSLHHMGLKCGIYSSPGPLTCGGFLGSYQHERNDAKTYIKWGIDYLKYDWCSYANIANDGSLSELMKPYLLMNKELIQNDRDIVYSLCQYGMGDVWKWGSQAGGNLWRTTGDITDQWEVVSELGFSQTKNALYAGPGHWNDPDMLTLGWVGWGPNLHPSRLTPNEQYAHMSLWCLLSAPLLIGCDVSKLDDFTLNLLTNDEVLALDQDPLGKQAAPVYKSDNIQIWMKELADGSKAIGIFNLRAEPEKITVHLSDLGLKEAYSIRDIWQKKDIGKFNATYETTVSNHGVKLLKLNTR
jgi:hypothetical protein